MLGETEGRGLSQEDEGLTGRTEGRGQKRGSRMATHLGFVRESEVGAKKSISIDNGRVRLPCRSSPRSSYELVSDGADIKASAPQRRPFWEQTSLSELRIRILSFPVQHGPDFPLRLL